MHKYILGKREAEPYYGYGGYGLFAPALATVDTGLIVSPSSGAITPDFTNAQKEEKPEIADGSEAIKGVVVVGKREAKAEPWLGLPGPWSFPGLVAHPGGAVTTDYTPAQKAAVANLVAEANRNLAGGKREAEAEPWLGLPGPWSYPGLVAHPGGAVTTDYTPAQKAAIANLVAEANRNLAGGKRDAEADPWVVLHPTGANVPVAYDPATGLVTHSDGAVTPPYTADQHIAVANLAAHGLWHY